MPNLHVVAVLTAKPGDESILRGALEELVVETRKEDGNVSYDLFASATDPSAFVMLEVWRAQADLDSHMKSAHIAKTFKVVGSHLAGAPVIHPLEAIDALV